MQQHEFFFFFFFFFFCWGFTNQSAKWDHVERDQFYLTTLLTFTG